MGIKPDNLRTYCPDPVTKVKGFGLVFGDSRAVLGLSFRVGLFWCIRKRRRYRVQKVGAPLV